MPALKYRTKLPRPDDPYIIATVCNGIRSGLSIRAVAAMVGISKTTLMDWLTQGRHELAQADLNGEELGSHALFAAQAEVAYAEFEGASVDVINTAIRAGGPKSWIPALAMVRSRYPEEWVEKPDRGNMTLNVGSVNILNLEAALPPQALLAAGQYLIAQAQLALPEGEPDS